MSSPRGTRDVVRIRTFADDFERAKSGGVQPSEQDVRSASSTMPEVVDEQNKKQPRKRKPETLRESIETNLDAAGITFDKDISKDVTDQAYEESRAVVEAEKDPQHEILEIPQIEETNTLASAPKTSILSDDTSFNSGPINESIGGGTIIRDTKRKRFKLIPAIIASVENWFSEKKETYEEEHREKYTVTKTQERVDTIKAAAQKKTQAPDEDYKQVAERLKKTERTPIRENDVAIKPKEELQPPQWSYTTEDAVEKTAADFQSAQHKTEATPKSSETKTALEQKVQETKREAVSEPAAQIPVAKPEEVSKTSAAPIPQELPKVQPRKQQITPNNLSPQRSFAPSPFIAIAVVCVAVILGVGASFYFFGRDNTGSTVSTTSIRSLVATQNTSSVYYSDDHLTMFDRILNVIDNNSESVHVYAVENTAAGEQQVTAEMLAQLLTPNAPGSFTRSITNINFGGVSSKPFILLRVTTFDTAFAGMLAWEQTMSADLVPLFGSVVHESFDPHARTDTQVREAFFKDIVSNNLSARLLVDENGEDRIVYAFLDKNTIVITTTRELLAEILPLVR